MSINCNAQNTSSKLMKSDTTWLNSKLMYIGTYSENTTFYYRTNPPFSTLESHNSETKYKYIGFAGTDKRVHPKDKDLGYYYKKVPVAYNVFNKARKFNKISNYAFFTPFPVILFAKAVSFNTDFWSDYRVPIISYGITSLIIFTIFKLKSTKLAYMAVPIYNKSLEQKYYKLHK